MRSLSPIFISLSASFVELGAGDEAHLVSHVAVFS